VDYLLVILGTLAILAGIAGSILPGLPGPPMGYMGLLLIHWSRFAGFSLNTLILLGLVVAFVSVLDYIIPVWGTKRFGGTKAGVRGSTIGLIAGVVLLPMFGIVLGPFGLIGIIGGPFIGAYMGERYGGQNSQKAMRAAFGSFVGFMAGTFMKIALSLLLGFYFFRAVWQAVF